MEQGFLQAGCPSCHPTISVKALKGKKSTDPNQWPGLILSSSTTGLLMKQLLLSLHWLSDTSTLAPSLNKSKGLVSTSRTMKCCALLYTEKKQITLAA